MVTTGEAAPATVVGATTADVDDVVVFVGAEGEGRLEHGGRVVDFEVMPTFAAIGCSIVGCFAGEDKGLMSIPVRVRGEYCFLVEGVFDELFGFVFWDALDWGPSYAIVIGAMNRPTLVI